MPFGAGGGVGRAGLGVGPDEGVLDGALISGRVLGASHVMSMSMAPSFIDRVEFTTGDCGRGGCGKAGAALGGVGGRVGSGGMLADCIIECGGKWEGAGIDVVDAIGGSIRLAMDGEADARFTCGDV